MPHIDLPAGAPGITGLLVQYRQTGGALCALAETLLRGESSLTPGERETIAAYVSSLNNCNFCMNSHASAAEHLLGSEAPLVRSVITERETSTASPKLKALLAIAAKVQQGGRQVEKNDIDRARSLDADDQAIHDTVVIAAAFCMFNRYVDGLDTLIPDESVYDQMGAVLAEQGYLRAR